MSMMEFAKHVLAVAQSSNQTVTNLQLQKVMYFTLKTILNQGSLSNDELNVLYDTSFFVWRYGPVIPEIYEEYRIFSASPILYDGTIDDKFTPFNQLILDQLRERPYDLVHKSHEEDFWKNNEDKIQGWRSDVPYSLDDIKG